MLDNELADLELRADGSTKSYFLKIAMGDPGHKMLQGEYEGVKAIHDIVPEFVPRPIAWGKYKSAEATYFFLADFIPMVQDVQKPEAFCEMLARLHKKSTEKSPNGKWGFHVVTCGVRLSRAVSLFLRSRVPTILKCQFQSYISKYGKREMRYPDFGVIYSPKFHLYHIQILHHEYGKL